LIIDVQYNNYKKEKNGWLDLNMNAKVGIVSVQSEIGWLTPMSWIIENPVEGI